LQATMTECHYIYCWISKLGS